MFSFAEISAKFDMARNIKFNLSLPALWNYAKFRFLPLREEMSLRRYGPIILHVLITRRCNLACSFCVAVKLLEGYATKTWNDYEADPQKFSGILDHPITRKVLAIHFLGGEPLLNKHLPELISMAAKRGHITVLTTNGILFRNSAIIEDLKSSGINRISISLYDNTIDAMKEILPNINSIKRTYTNMVLLRTMLKNNPERIWEAIDISRASGCCGIVLNHCVDVMSETYNNDTIFDDNRFYLHFKEETKIKFRKFNIVWNTPAAGQIRNDRRWCKLLWNGITMDMAGNVGRCCAVYPRVDGRDGNFFLQAPDILLNQAPVKAMRRLLLDKVAPLPKECRYCCYLGNPWMNNR
jgi:sulfatase maturation enzyme AslB (radical SAM superfamily)